MPSPPRTSSGLQSTLQVSEAPVLTPMPSNGDDQNLLLPDEPQRISARAEPGASTLRMYGISISPTWAAR